MYAREASSKMTGYQLRVVDEKAIVRRQGQVVADPPTSKLVYLCCAPGPTSLMPTSVGAGILVWCNQEGGKKTFVRARVLLSRIAGIDSDTAPVHPDVSQIKVTVKLRYAGIQAYKDHQAQQSAGTPQLLVHLLVRHWPLRRAKGWV